ncbi:MAG: hypothetical protein HQK53_18100, partial [Oligoflexia bacterium]|nr:hypothetical protein [Oligoflexia bacterium]
IRSLFAQYESCLENLNNNPSLEYLIEKQGTTTTNRFMISTRNDNFDAEGLKIKSYSIGAPDVPTGKYEGYVNFTVTFLKKTIEIPKTISLRVTSNVAGPSVTLADITSCSLSAVGGSGSGSFFSRDENTIYFDEGSIRVKMFLTSSVCTDAQKGSITYNSNPSLDDGLGLRLCNDDNEWVSVSTSSTKKLAKSSNRWDNRTILPKICNIWAISSAVFLLVNM